MKNVKYIQLIKVLAVTSSVSILVACSGEKHGDLRAYVNEVKARKGGRIAPLPEIQPYETFAYSAHTIRDPFLPYISEQAEQEVVDSGIRPDMNRKREALEQFSLDSLSFVGHLEKGGVKWALIAAPDKTVYRVQVGNYLGSNYGEITQITETTITLKEIIPSGTGGWIDREASLALTE